MKSVVESLEGNKVKVSVTVDSSEFPGSGPFLTGLTLTGDVLSWSHAGKPRSVTLTH